MSRKAIHSLRRIDGDLLEEEFVFGTPISKGIPWEKFSEIEIQGIVKIHFERLGFNVIWRHKDDPSHEGGIDLECNYEKSNKKILIAVKKKPKVSDIGQMVQLFQSKADKRIYIYIGGSTQSFRNQIIQHKSKIDFYDEKKLEYLLDDSGLSIALKIDNSNAVKSISNVNKKILEIITSIRCEDYTCKKFPKPNTATLKTIWDLKDRSATLNKCALMAQLIFESPTVLGKMNYAEIQKLQISFLDFFYTYSLLSISEVFSKLSLNLNSILSCVYDETRARSNWMMLITYQPGFIPGNIESIIQKRDIPHNFNQKQAIFQNISSNQNISGIEKKYFEEARSEFCRIAVWAYGLEETINDMYQGCIEEIKK